MPIFAQYARNMLSARVYNAKKQLWRDTIPIRYDTKTAKVKSNADASNHYRTEP